MVLIFLLISFWQWVQRLRASDRWDMLQRLKPGNCRGGCCWLPVRLRPKSPESLLRAGIGAGRKKVSRQDGSGCVFGEWAVGWYPPCGPTRRKGHQAGRSAEFNGWLSLSTDRAAFCAVRRA